MSTSHDVPQTPPQANRFSFAIHVVASTSLSTVTLAGLLARSKSSSARIPNFESRSVRFGRTFDRARSQPPSRGDHDLSIQGLSFNRASSPLELQLYNVTNRLWSAHMIPRKSQLREDCLFRSAARFGA